jgi:REP-associated tyrosine transposase
VLDASIVMPDHFHAIALLQCLANGPASVVALPTMMQWFKTMTTAEYFRGVRNKGWQRVDRRVWQRSYYDRIIRSERELLEIRTYIESNPGALYERNRRLTCRLLQCTSTCRH